VLAGYAGALSDLGRCDEAEAAGKSAMDSMPERSTTEERQNVTERLRVLMGKCAGGGGRLDEKGRAPGGARPDESRMVE
jgi:hypothetical protein